MTEATDDMLTSLHDIDEGAQYDLVVAGSGAGGMGAALFAAIEGKKVLLVERTEYLGGTSSLSAATTWVPNTRHAATFPGEDTPEKAATFLDAVVGNTSSRDLRSAFLAAGPAAIAKLEANSQVQFRAYARHPDYVQEAPGATVRSRALEPVPFDGRALGAALSKIRPPIPEFTIFGGMMVDRTDINHLLGMTKSFGSAKHAARILGRYGLDRISHPRGTRLVMGNALIGRMLASLLDRNVDIVTDTSIRELHRGAAGIDAVTMEGGGVRRRVGTALGVVSASGGFGRNPELRAELLHKPTPDYSPAAPGHTGEMQALALKLGARRGEGAADNAFWAPVSVRKRPDGTTAVFPHFVLDRGKPGTVSVNQAGKRFVNESVSYHEFARAMFATHATVSAIPTYLIADAVALKKYGLGMVRPNTRDLSSFKADGYLVEAPSISKLAQKLGVDASNLEVTIAEMNGFAVTGKDTAFGRGTTAYHNVNGDAENKPNPNLGFIRTAPFYAVRLHPGDIGAATGLVTDANAQVLGEGNQPIGKLYAVGNDMQSIMGGTYPGPGITIGPAIVFAYRAIQHAIGRPA